MRYAIAEDVAWVDGAEVAAGDPTIYAMCTPHGRPVIMDGIARLIWLLIAENEPVVESISAMTGEPPENIRDTCAEFIQGLSDMMLLTPLPED